MVKQGFIDQLIPFILSPYGLIIIGAFVIIIILVYKFGKSKKPDGFIPEKLDDVVNENLEDLITVMGEKKGGACLRMGYHILGRVIRVSELHHKDLAEIDKKGKVIKEGEVHTFYGFLICEDNPIKTLIAKWFGTGLKPFLIDKSAVKFDGWDYIIAEKTQLSKFTKNVYILSGAGREFLESFAWKRWGENQVEDTMNWNKKITYLDSQQSKRVELAEKFDKLQRGRWDSRVEGLVAQSEGGKR